MWPQKERRNTKAMIRVASSRMKLDQATRSSMAPVAMRVIADSMPPKGQRASTPTGRTASFSWCRQPRVVAAANSTTSTASRQPLMRF